MAHRAPSAETGSRSVSSAPDHSLVTSSRLASSWPSPQSSPHFPGWRWSLGVIPGPPDSCWGASALLSEGQWHPGRTRGPGAPREDASCVPGMVLTRWFDSRLPGDYHVPTCHPQNSHSGQGGRRTQPKGPSPRPGAGGKALPCPLGLGRGGGAGREASETRHRKGSTGRWTQGPEGLGATRGAGGEAGGLGPRQGSGKILDAGDRRTWGGLGEVSRLTPRAPGRVPAELLRTPHPERLRPEGRPPSPTEGGARQGEPREAKGNSVTFNRERQTHAGNQHDIEPRFSGSRTGTAPRCPPGSCCRICGSRSLGPASGSPSLHEDPPGLTHSLPGQGRAGGSLPRELKEEGAGGGAQPSREPCGVYVGRGAQPCPGTESQGGDDALFWGQAG